MLTVYEPQVFALKDGQMVQLTELPDNAVLFLAGTSLRVPTERMASEMGLDIGREAMRLRVADAPTAPRPPKKNRVPFRREISQ